MRKRGKLWAAMGVLLLVAGFIVVGCTVFQQEPGHQITETSALEEEIEEDEPIAGEEEELKPNPKVTIVAVGDVMMHDGQIWAGYNESDGTFDYSEFFHVVKDEISSADLAMADLETTLAGEAEKYTGYPCFNSPDALADTLKDAGFDIIITANNHCLDRGASGALRTLEVLKDRGLSPLGTYASEEERNQILIKEVNDIKVAFLAYTYGTNGIPIPKDMPYLVKLLDEELIMQDLEKAKELADAVVVYFHYGEEYQRQPSKEQKALALKALMKGANIVVASHVHVIQPSERIDVQDSDGEIVMKYAAYSLGNFISAQRFPHTEEGIMLKFTLEKDLVKDKVYLIEVEEIDTWVDKFVRDGKMRYVVRYGKKP